MSTSQPPAAPPTDTKNLVTVTNPVSDSPILTEAPSVESGMELLKRLAVSTALGFALFVSVRANKTIKNWVSMTFLLWFFASFFTGKLGVGFSVGVALLYSLVKIIQYGTCLLDLNRRIVANVNNSGIFKGYRCEIRRSGTKSRNFN